LDTIAKILELSTELSATEYVKLTHDSRKRIKYLKIFKIRKKGCEVNELRIIRGTSFKVYSWYWTYFGKKYQWDNWGS
jgi:hypothetical protein